LLSVEVALLLRNHLGALLVREELLLVNLHVHLLDEQAVSGNTVTLTKQHHVANDDVLAENSL